MWIIVFVFGSPFANTEHRKYIERTLCQHNNYVVFNLLQYGGVLLGFYIRDGWTTGTYSANADESLLH